MEDSRQSFDDLTVLQNAPEKLADANLHATKDRSADLITSTIGLDTVHQGSADNTLSITRITASHFTIETPGNTNLFLESFDHLSPESPEVFTIGNTSVDLNRIEVGRQPVIIPIDPDVSIDVETIIDNNPFFQTIMSISDNHLMMINNLAPIDYSDKSVQILPESTNVVTLLYDIDEVLNSQVTNTVTEPPVTEPPKDDHDDNGHGNDIGDYDPSNPGKGHGSKKDHDDNGHGNDIGDYDPSNPGIDRLPDNFDVFNQNDFSTAWTETIESHATEEVSFTLPEPSGGHHGNPMSDDDLINSYNNHGSFC